ncbi:MAG: O-antigen ligase family protein [Bacteroidales bacterium]|nr:O-antigen ligase family protein [Bacteroidales bacterium]
MTNKLVLNKVFSIIVLIYLFALQIFPPLWANDVTSLRHFLIALFVVVSSFYIFFFLLKKHEKLISPFVFGGFKVWILLVVLMYLSLIWAVNPTEAFVVSNRWLLILMSSVIISILLSDRTDLLNVIVYSAMAVALVNVVTCIVGYYYFDCADYPNKIPMINGGYGNKNIFAVCLMFKLPFLYYALLKYKRVFKVISSVLIVAVCFCLPIISTRSAFVCLALNIIILIVYSVVNFLHLKKKDYLFKALLICVLLLGGFVLGSYFVTYNYKHGGHKQANAYAVSQRIKETGTGKSSQVRIGIWKNTIAVAKQRPVLGYGAGNHKIVIMKEETPQKSNFIVSDHAHNDFLEMFSELGLVGLILYISFYLAIIVAGFRIILSRYTQEPYRLLSLVSLMLLFTYMNDAMFNFPNERATPQIYLALSVALMSLSYLKYREQKAKTESKERKMPMLNVYAFGFISLLSLFTFATETIHFYSSVLQYQRIVCYNNKNRKGIPPSYWKGMFPPFPNIDESTRPIAIGIGNMYAQQGDYRNAVDIVLHDNSNPYLAIKEHSLAVWYSNMNMPDSSIFYADRCLKMKPRHYASLKIKLNNLKRLGKDGEAMKVLDGYIKEHPLNYKPWLEKADTYINGKDYFSAKQTLENALEVLPEEKNILKKLHVVDSILNLEPVQAGL